MAAGKGVGHQGTKSKCFEVDQLDIVDVANRHGSNKEEKKHRMADHRPYG